MPSVRKSGASIRVTRSSTSSPNKQKIQRKSSARGEGKGAPAPRKNVEKKRTARKRQVEEMALESSESEEDEQYEEEEEATSTNRTLPPKTRSSTSSAAISVPSIGKRTSNVSISSGSPELGVTQQRILRIKRETMSPTKTAAAAKEMHRPLQLAHSLRTRAKSRLLRPVAKPTPRSMPIPKKSPVKRTKTKETGLSSKMDSRVSTPPKNVTTPGGSSFRVPANYSPRKTRSLRRQEIDGDENGLAKCLQCHHAEPTASLRECPQCESQFHLSCLNLQAETIQYLEENPNKWSCPRCIECTKCGEYIVDPGNVQCTYCARAWHGECRPKRTHPPEYPYNKWMCEACKANFKKDNKQKIISASSPPVNVASSRELSLRRKTVRSALQSGRILLQSPDANRTPTSHIKWEDEKKEEEEPQQEKRQTRSSVKIKAEQQKMKRPPPAAEQKHAEAKRSTLRIQERELDMEAVRQREKHQLLSDFRNRHLHRGQPNNSNKSELEESDMEAEEEEEGEDESADEEMMADEPSTSKKAAEQPKRGRGKPKKQQSTRTSCSIAEMPSSPKTSKRAAPAFYPRGGAHQRKNSAAGRSAAENGVDDAEMDTYALQMRMFAEMGLNPEEPDSNRNERNTWIQFGQFVRYKPLYESAYKEPIQSAIVVYICEFCLTPLAQLEHFKSHVMFCPRRYPPGNEIYRNSLEHWNIWEVEGNLETHYCRNLCLMAKFFMASKTLFHEVDTFTFYILTEITPRGCVVVGYFSKEKNPSKNNNLSCLLTLPSAQGKGYGKLLIDLSYQLSKLEHKIGSPEHPLSDLGLLAYRNYWRAVIFSALRQRRNSHTISIKDLSVETAIHGYDIVSTLLYNGMLEFRRDSYYIDIDKALNTSLATLRRRFIKPEHLMWLPTFDPNPMNKMCSYVFVD